MQISALRCPFHFPMLSNLTIPVAKTPHLLSIKTISYSKHPSNSFPTRTSANPRKSVEYLTKTNQRTKPLILKPIPNDQTPSKQEFLEVSSNGFARFVILGAVSLGFALVLAGIDDQKALALGPEGPLMEEFWDNMRRYGLYILTVSTGVIYTIFQPILELLKNPISAILIITILGGSVYIVSQVLSAMVGVSEFAYEYGY